VSRVVKSFEMVWVVDIERLQVAKMQPCTAFDCGADIQPRTNTHIQTCIQT